MMSASAPLLPEDILLLIIHAYVDSATKERHLHNYSSLRLVNSFFNDSILHDVFSLRPPSERKVPGSHNIWYRDSTRFASFIAVRYLQGSLFRMSNQQPLEDLSQPFFASILKAVDSLRQLLSDHNLGQTVSVRSIQQRQQLSRMDIFRSILSCRRSSRSSVFNDIPTILVCCAVTRFCQPKGVVRAILGPIRDHPVRRKHTDDLTGLWPDFWLFFTACCMEDIGLARHSLPRALENAPSSWPLEIRDGVSFQCLSAFVEEDLPQIFRFLLGTGVDARESYQARNGVDDIGFKSPPELLSMLLESQYRFQRSDANYEAADFRAATRDDVVIPQGMIEMLTNACDEPVDDTTVRQKLLAEACLHTNLDLADALLDDDGNAFIYKRHVHRDVICHLGIQHARHMAAKLEMIRLVYRNIHKFAPADETLTNDLATAEWSALHYTRDLEVFQELLLHVVLLTQVQRFLIACEREGGIAEVEKHDPAILDLASTSDDAVLNDFGGMKSDQFVIGTEAVARAVTYGCIDNVEILLDRGAKVVGRTQLFVGWATKEPEKFTALQALFSRETSPRVEIRKTRFDPRTYRHHREGIV